jgi:Asp-tRNA(Asn)/Glu-tRNA(Gln) amidotransferase C subunit
MPRIDVALVYTDGRREVVTVGRPADLIAFADTFEKIAPSEPFAVRELAWLAHHALKVEQPLDEWVETLDDITSDTEQVAAVRVELGELDPGEAAVEAATPLRPEAELPPTDDRRAIEHEVESLG